MIILLVFLPALVLSAESLIEWRECSSSNSKCFCPDLSWPKLEQFTFPPKPEDFPPQATPEQIEQVKTDSLARCAKVGIESKFFDVNIALFRMQVLGDDTKNVGDSPEQKLYQGDEFLFGCKFEKGKAKLIGDPDNKYKLSLFEDRSRFIKGEIAHCAILSKAAVKLGNDQKSRSGFATAMKLENGATPIVFATKTVQIDIFKSQDDELAIKCNPYSFMDLDVSQKYKILPLMNRDKMQLNCANYGELYNLRYKMISSGKEDTFKELECILTSEEYIWNIIKEDPTENEAILEPELYQFYCAANIEKFCEDPRENCASNPAICPRFVPGSTDKMATLECTDKKWLIDGEYHKLDSDPICKKDPMKDNGATFYAKLPSNATKEIDNNARCFTSYDCKSKSNLALPQGDDINSLADDSNGILECKNRTRILTIIHSATNVMLNESSSYTCDPNDGQWKNETIVVPINSRVRCIDIATAPKREVQEVTFTETKVYFMIAGAVLALYGTLAIIAGICHCVRKNKFNIATKMATGMKKMDRAKLIANCKEEFGEMLTATPSEAHLLVDGLNKINLLLKEEVDEPEVWEEARKFLMRLHAAFRVMDMPLRYMLSRYLYLQAKQIVDKYGWTAPTPIRNKRRDGLMRTVALRLLSFSFDDKTSPESAQLVFRAFRELGWKGMTQYPHAGVTWSLIYHMRPNMFESTADKTRKAFDEDKFIQTLRDILSSTVEMKIHGPIPAFGTVAQQAAYALGSCPNFRYLRDESVNILTKTKKDEHGAVPKRFFEGVCLSPYRNPIAGLLDFFGMTDKRDEKFLALMNAVAPEGDWHKLAEEAARVATYYGRHLDVKLIYERYMPPPAAHDRGIAKSAHANVDFVKMQLEQKLFEAAIEKAKEDIRAWFCAHTDRPEYKKRPDYSANPKGDHLVGEFKPFNDGCGDKFAAASRSPDTKSEGKSSDGKSGGAKSSDTKSSGNAKPPAASEPREGAAAAAAAATPATTDPAATPVVSAAPATPHA